MRSKSSNMNEFSSEKTMLFSSRSTLITDAAGIDGTGAALNMSVSPQRGQGFLEGICFRVKQRAVKSVKMSVFTSPPGPQFCYLSTVTIRIVRIAS